MDEHAKYAFSFAADTSKQITALATGALAVEIAFAKDFNKKLDDFDVFFLESSWVFLTISILMGLFVLMALTGTAGKVPPPAAVDVYNKNIKYTFIAQLMAFYAGLLAVVVFAMRGV
jgi:hypothetical protein